MTLLVYAFFNLVAAGALADRIGRKWTLLACLGIFALAYVGCALSARVALLAVLFLGYGLSQGGYRVVGKTYASDLLSERLRASGLGRYATVIGLTGFVASSVGGWLWTHVSPATTFLYGAGFAVMAALALLVLLPTRPPTGQQ